MVYAVNGVLFDYLLFIEVIICYEKVKIVADPGFGIWYFIYV